MSNKSKHWPTSSRAIIVLVVIAALAVLLQAHVASAIAEHSAHTAAIDDRPWFGILQTSGNSTYLDEERAAGVTVATLEIGWDIYEPQQGVYNVDYINEQKEKLKRLRAAGMKAVLDVGLQYPPAWVFKLDPNTRFVNQYGDVWQGQLSEDPPNAVFDPNVRKAEADYIAQVAADLGDSFYAIRAGGLLMNELRYPPATVQAGSKPNESRVFGKDSIAADPVIHTNSYWAFDNNARAADPVSGWLPGQNNAPKARQFLNYYLSSLTRFQNWLVGTYRKNFSGWIEVLYPGWGMRPGDFHAAVESSLDGSAARAGETSMGQAWIRQVNSLTDPKVIAYCTWLEGRSYDAVTPLEFLAGLAHEKGLPVAGENGGSNDMQQMEYVVAQVRKLKLAGMMWMSESSLLWGSPSLSDYSDLIGGHVVGGGNGTQ